MKRLITLLLIVLVCNSLSAQLNLGFGKAGEATDTTPSLLISGFLDSYYSYNINKPGLRGNAGTTRLGRFLDVDHNQISFNMFQLQFAYQSKRLQVVGDLAMGPGGEAFNYGNTGTARVIKQAYIAYTLNKATFTVGQFSTHIGYELINVPENLNYSVSYLFTFGPYYHTGAKMDYAFSDKLGAMVGILNGWDRMKDNNSRKTFTTQLSYTPSEKLNLYLNWIGGNEESFTSSSSEIDSYKQLFDLSVNSQLSKKVKLGLNLDVGFYELEKNDVKNWGGTALYLEYAFNEVNKIGGRAELFEDTHNVQGLNDSYTGFTLTYIKSLEKGHLLLKPEIRYDATNKAIYYYEGNRYINSQFTIGLAVIGTI